MVEKQKSQKWYIFKRNEDQEYVKLRRVFDSKREAEDYAADHNYQFSMISSSPTLYVHKEH